MLNTKYPIILIKLVLIILFFISLLKMPYNFYEIMRFVAMVGFIIIGFFSIQKRNILFAVIWIASALLINPFIKLALGREIWIAIDIIWITILILSFFKGKKRE